MKTIEHNNRQNINKCIRNLTVTERDGKQLKIIECKVYRRILGPLHDNKKWNYIILTNKEMYARFKNLL
jgi:hypothetical protein